MNRFLQLHLLTTYPPSNPNRDDLGRPKTARFGNAERMRISSQALKRAIRISDAFTKTPELTGALGERTLRLGEEIINHLTAKGTAPEKASEIAKNIAVVFGKIDDKKPELARIKQLAFVSPKEKQLAFELADKALDGEEMPKDKELTKLILQNADGAIDIAMFGRMLADSPAYNREAAVQIAHAITTNKITIENDFYTAVDDLKKTAEDAGAGFIGELGFSSGVFYIYCCINKELLIENLDGDKALAAASIKALIESLTTSSPDGKKNSFAHGSRAEFVLAEQGNQQTRTLAGAFLKPVDEQDLMQQSIKCLTEYRSAMDTAYGKCAEATNTMHLGQSGSLEELKSFSVKDMG